jgi:hypothetical protein
MNAVAGFWGVEFRQASPEEKAAVQRAKKLGAQAKMLLENSWAYRTYAKRTAGKTEGGS